MPRRPDGTRTADYDFPLPTDLIAQTPATRRDESRLMVIDRASGTITHRIFRDLPASLSAGDALVLNTTRVFRARLLGTRASGAPAEVLLLHPIEGHSLDATTWEAMVQPGAKLKPGRVVTIASDFSVEIGEVLEGGTRIVHLRTAHLECRRDQAVVHGPRLGGHHQATQLLVGVQGGIDRARMIGQ